MEKACEWVFNNSNIFTILVLLVVQMWTWKEHYINTEMARLWKRPVKWIWEWMSDTSYIGITACANELGRNRYTCTCSWKWLPSCGKGLWRNKISSVLCTCQCDPPGGWGDDPRRSDQENPPGVGILTLTFVPTHTPLGCLTLKMGRHIDWCITGWQKYVLYRKWHQFSVR